MPEHLQPDSPHNKKIVIFTNKEKSDIATSLLKIQNKEGRLPNLTISAIVSNVVGKAPKGFVPIISDWYKTFWSFSGLSASRRSL